MAGTSFSSLETPQAACYCSSLLAGSHRVLICSHGPWPIISTSKTQIPCSFLRYYTSLGLFVISVPGLWSHQTLCQIQDSAEDVRVGEGAYYWKRASRKEQINVKMLVADDGTVSEVVVVRDDQQVDQMRKEVELSEKGMVYVKGLFER